MEYYKLSDRLHNLMDNLSHDNNKLSQHINTIQEGGSIAQNKLKKKVKKIVSDIPLDYSDIEIRNKSTRRGQRKYKN